MVFRTIRSTGANILQSWATYIRIVIIVGIIIIVIITSISYLIRIVNYNYCTFVHLCKSNPSLLEVDQWS